MTSAGTPRQSNPLMDNLPYILFLAGVVVMIFGWLTIDKLVISGFLGPLLGPLLIVVGLGWGMVRDWKKKPYSVINKIPMLWDLQYAIGNPTIDGQHRELLERIQRLMAASSSGGGSKPFQEALQFLVKYVEEHFRDEEGIMGKANYPGLAVHLEQHAGFRKQVEEWTRDPGKLENPENQQAFVSFVLDWLIKHILIEDKKVGQHLAHHP